MYHNTDLNHGTQRALVNLGDSCARSTHLENSETYVDYNGSLQVVLPAVGRFIHRPQECAI